MGYTTEKRKEGQDDKLDEIQKVKNFENEVKFHKVYLEHLSVCYLSTYFNVVLFHAPKAWATISNPLHDWILKNVEDINILDCCAHIHQCQKPRTFKKIKLIAIYKTEQDDTVFTKSKTKLVAWSHIHLNDWISRTATQQPKT